MLKQIDSLFTGYRLACNALQYAGHFSGNSRPHSCIDSAMIFGFFFHYASLSLSVLAFPLRPAFRRKWLHILISICSIFLCYSGRRGVSRWFPFGAGYLSRDSNYFIWMTVRLKCRAGVDFKLARIPCKCGLEMGCSQSWISPLVLRSIKGYVELFLIVQKIAL